MHSTALPPDLNPAHLPRHIAVIMDGNGRWATQRGLPRIAGHRQGAKTLKALLQCCQDWGIPVLTAYAFSTENWRRPLEEVTFLLRLFERLLHQELRAMQQAGVRVRFIGDLTALPESLQTLMSEAAAATADNDGIEFNVAVNYGSRLELTQAFRGIAADLLQGKIRLEDFQESWVEARLFTAGSPDPDLLIRTSGEQRLSNYLLWQLAYAELYFTNVLWPDFDREALAEALRAYQGRDRKFGGLPPTYLTA
ncbi:MAG: isoprenyl transferase [Cyanobacteria bacterium Co-bin13]|nr:isoprenyl transferase [Cyanobacteria bacterium Co-bin13]